MDPKVNELLERIRATACAAADAAADTARVAGRKAGQMVDVAKLNVQLFDANGELDETLKKLGGVMYDAHLGRENNASVDDLLAQADAINERRDELKSRIAALRQSRTCPACGGTCGKEDRFCRRCGATL